MKNKWRGLYACKSCDKAMDWNTKMYSDGMCPHCGYCSVGTICDATVIVYKMKRVSPWWRFWNRKYVYAAKDLTSKKWLTDHGYPQQPF